MKRLLILLLFASPAFGHSALLGWTPSSDAVANPTLIYNVYRSTGGCTGSFTRVGTAATPSYTDISITIGTYCYYVTSTLNGAESVPSNTVSAVVLPAAPTALKVTGVN